MLQKIREDEDVRHILFNEIGPDSSGTGLCFVRDGQHRTTRWGKPYIVLYLQDINKTVIPGYIFDIESAGDIGSDLSKVIQNLVEISYEENYLEKYGLSVRIKKVHLVTDPTTDLLAPYVHSFADNEEKYKELMGQLSEIIGIKVSIPYSVCSMYNLLYHRGEIGGVIQHYYEMFSVLKTYATFLRNPEDVKKLFSTFLLYIYANINYLNAEAKGEADITLVTQLISAVSTYSSKLTTDSGIMEVVHGMFGYEPKDIFVRLVFQVSKDVERADKEISLWHSLPNTREGNAGYGTIRKYL